MDRRAAFIDLRVPACAFPSWVGVLTWALVLSLGTASPSAAASPKRGWAGSDVSHINGMNASWHYNWWHTPPDGDASSNGEWIPLIKYPNSITAKLNTIQSYSGGVDTLLVLNEPERVDQSDTTVAEALAIWPEIQTTLPTVKLVAPGVSDDPAGRAWLADFMGQVNTLNGNGNSSDDIRVDAIAFHWYGGSNPSNPVATANSFLSRVDFYHNTYNKPVWITEFAMHDWEGDDTDAEMITANRIFLETVIPALESRSYVEGYAFYHHFSDAPLISGTPVTPTEIGDVYVDTKMSGETLELNGVSLGTDVTYMRGGAITNSGAALGNAMRAIDALSNSSSFGGAGNWKVGGGARSGGSFVRVRAGATLTKTGVNTVTLDALNLENSGTLRVSGGTLQLLTTALDGPGTTIIDAGATLDTALNASPTAFTNHPVRLSGQLLGAANFSANAVLEVTSSTAIANGNLTFTNATLNIGGDGFNEAGPGLLPIRTNLQLEFDAALDTPGDNVWSSAVGTDSLQFAANASPIAVSSTALPGLTAAYSIPTSGGATGLNGYFEANGPRSTQDATFEVAFRVASNSTAANQVLLEVGGTNSGVAFVLNGDSLLFNVDGTGGDLNLTQTLTPGWHHAVGVVDLNSGNDTVSLYVNGALAGTLAGQVIGDWSGGNLTGLGKVGDVMTGTTGTAAAYHADIALARYYANTAFNLASVQQNYNALATVADSQATTFEINGNLNLSAGSRLKLDLGGNNSADRLDISQALTLAGAIIEVGFVGTNPLVGGESFNLIDAASISGTISTLTLPTLTPGLMWRTDRLLVDGTISTTLAGDFNADGAVDSADYTLWRDASPTAAVAWTSADANGDRLVDAADYGIWAANFGRQLGPPSAVNAAAVPELTSVRVAAVLAGLLVAAFRKQGNVR